MYESEQEAEKKERFTALLHHVDVDLLRAAFSWLKRDAAPGWMGLTWAEYEQNLEANLVDLHARVHRGAYRALPSRRKFIPKADGRERPLGIAALEDKIVQRAVVEVLNAIYEEDFLGFTYGFRPGRGQHDALDALAVGITRTPVNWILDADVRSFFDSVSHEWLIRFVEHRIGDPRMIRLIRKWLKAGVMEDGEWSSSETGTPQGAVVSPLLANIYLHYVFDLWAERWRRHEAHGNVILVRYADDIVAGFEHEADAERFLADLRERLEKFALSLHPDKTRLIEFGRHAADNRKKRGLGKPETFNFLGFTHICGRSRRGVLPAQTEDPPGSDAQQAAGHQRAIAAADACADSGAGRWLAQVVRGYFAYHAVPTNCRSLAAFRYHVTDLWRRTLRRRSQKDRTTWERITRLAAAYLPPARDPSSLAARPLCRQTPKVGARCANRARRDLCGGRPVTGVPTAIRNSKFPIFPSLRASNQIADSVDDAIAWVRLRVRGNSSP